MNQKVLAYILRRRSQNLELLVFEHADFDAGIQIPKGTIYSNEMPEAAVRREVREESGLVQLSALTELDHVTRAGDEPEEWHLFAALAGSNIRDRWEHRVGGAGEDRGMLFRFYWLPLSLPPQLAGDQGVGLARLANYLAQNVGEP